MQMGQEKDASLIITPVIITSYMQEIKKKSFILFFF